MDSDVFLAPPVLPQAIALTHDHTPCACTPWEGGKTFVDEAPRPVLGRGVYRIGCVSVSLPKAGNMLVYIRSAPKREKIDRRHGPALCSD